MSPPGVGEGVAALERLVGQLQASLSAQRELETALREEVDRLGGSQLQGEHPADTGQGCLAGVQCHLAGSHIHRPGLPGWRTELSDRQSCTQARAAWLAYSVIWPAVSTQVKAVWLAYSVIWPAVTYTGHGCLAGV